MSDDALTPQKVSNSIVQSIDVFHHGDLSQRRGLCLLFQSPPLFYFGTLIKTKKWVDVENKIPEPRSSIPCWFPSPKTRPKNDKEIH